MKGLISISKAKNPKAYPIMPPKIEATVVIKANEKAFSLEANTIGTSIKMGEMGKIEESRKLIKAK